MLLLYLIWKSSSCRSASSLCEILEALFLVIGYWKQIKGDSPEKVEYIGMRNLIKAVKDNLGLRRGKLLFGFEG